MAYKSLDLQTHIFQQKVPYQITVLQGYFLSLLNNYIHGEKDLPYYIFPISFLEIGICSIKACIDGVRHLPCELVLLLAFA